MKIHEKIRTLRKEKNWTQEEMAEKLGMSILGYAKVERGETDYQLGMENYLSKIVKIADALGVDVENLIEGHEKHIYLVGLITGDNNCFNSPVIGSPAELAFELQKQQLIIELKDKELALQQREIENLREIIALLKTKNA
jgi:transcriptional regulator with XRE-family HTH domain